MIVVSIQYVTLRENKYLFNVKGLGLGLMEALCTHFLDGTRVFWVWSIAE